MHDFLEGRPNKSVPSAFLAKLMEKVLTLNIFEFNGSLYKQKVGTAMGTPSAVSYANVFMSSIDVRLKLLALHINEGIDPLLAFKRFIDDIFSIWVGSVDSLELFLSEMNNIHETIKFTYEYTCPYPCEIPEDVAHDCFCHTSRSVPFLDTLVTIKNGFIVTDLYRKPTDRCQYLLPSSCHPSNICRNVPFSCAYRLVRICSERQTLFLRLEELKQFFLTRHYNIKIVESALDRAKAIPRDEALKKVTKSPTDRVVFVLPYHPALPNVSKIVTSAWATMVKDPYLKEVFKKPPMVAYKRPKSLRDILVRAKVPPPNHRKSSRICNSMKKCNKCVVCPFVHECKFLKSSHGVYSVNINKPVNCETSNVVYLVECIKCKSQYVGQTGREFKARMKEHLGYIRNKKISEPTGQHFNLPGHDISMFRASILEVCKSERRVYREHREEHFIQAFQTKLKGMNRM